MPTKHANQTKNGSDEQCVLSWIPKAPEGWRTPRRFAKFGGAANMRQLLECGSLLPFSQRRKPFRACHAVALAKAGIPWAGNSTMNLAKYLSVFNIGLQNTFVYRWNYFRGAAILAVGPTGILPVDTTLSGLSPVRPSL